VTHAISILAAHPNICSVDTAVLTPLTILQTPPQTQTPTLQENANGLTLFAKSCLLLLVIVIIWPQQNVLVDKRETCLLLHIATVALMELVYSNLLVFLTHAVVLA